MGDLYLDPNGKAGAESMDQLRAAPRPIHYTDIETGEKCTLRWWTRLPASGEYKSRIKRQKAMANRLSQLPPIEKTMAKHSRSQSALGYSGKGNDRYDRVALETFNPWSPHQVNVRNFAVKYGNVVPTKPDRFNSKAMLAAGGFTDVLM